METDIFSTCFFCTCRWKQCKLQSEHRSTEFSALYLQMPMDPTVTCPQLYETNPGWLLQNLVTLHCPLPEQREAYRQRHLSNWEKKEVFIQLLTPYSDVNERHMGAL